jgi:hypothetical protein
MYCGWCHFRHVESEQARLAESGVVSCDALNDVSARYQKVASAVRSFEKMQAQRRKEQEDAAAAAAADAAASAAVIDTDASVSTRGSAPAVATGGSGGLRQRGSKREAATTGSDARSELLGADSVDGGGGGDSAGVGHAKLQEALAADMLQMTKTLKDIMKETGVCSFPVVIARFPIVSTCHGLLCLACDSGRTHRVEHMSADLCRCGCCRCRSPR